MAALRGLVAGAGHTDVATYLQSGNVVFSSTQRNASALAAGLEAAITEALGLQIRVLVRSGAAITKVVEQNPFPQHAEDASKLAVVFLEHPITAPLPALPDDAVESVEALGDHLYVWYPDGMGRTRLDQRFWRHVPGVTTARNWRTVLALRELVTA
jgi:uncharacterized protein (DUF1697 family)